MHFLLQIHFLSDECFFASWELTKKLQWTRFQQTIFQRANFQSARFAFRKRNSKFSNKICLFLYFNAIISNIFENISLKSNF